MLKHCSPSSVDLRRRSRRNLLSIIDNVNEEDCDTSTSSADMFKHVIEDLTEEELDLCEDVVSVKSFSSLSSGNRDTLNASPPSNNSHINIHQQFANNSTSSSAVFRGKESCSVLPKSRIVPKSSSIPLKVYAR